MKFSDIRRSEVTDIQELEDARIWHSDIVGVPIILISFEPRETSNGTAYLTDFFTVDENLNDDTEVQTVNMGSSIIRRQLDEFKHRLPIACRVEKTQSQGGGRPYYLLVTWPDEEFEAFLQGYPPTQPDEISI